MKSAISLTLMLCLVTPAIPVAAEDRMELTTGPIVRAVTREAARLAAADKPMPSGVEAVQQRDRPTRYDWSSVRKLSPGTEIGMTTRRSEPGKRYFVSADESSFTVLNLTQPTLSAAVTRALLETASNHPEYLVGAQNGTFLLDKNVHLAPDGVFVADRKVADLGQVVEKIARNDVVEIQGPVRARGSSVAGAIIGAGGGFFLGSLVYVRQALRDDCGGGRCTAGNAWAQVALVGLPIAGGILGYRTGSHKTQGVIYRAP